MADNINNYIDIPENKQHHINQKPLLTDWEIDMAEYSDYSKYQLLIDTCEICGDQQCYTHNSKYPMPPKSRRIKTSLNK